MNELDVFMASDIDIVSMTAKKADLYLKQLNKKEITSNEYAELMDDLISTAKLCEQMQSLHIQKVLTQVIDILLRMKAVVNLI